VLKDQQQQQQQQEVLGSIRVNLLVVNFMGAKKVIFSERKS